jgi:hypothetical protein
LKLFYFNKGTLCTIQNYFQQCHLIIKCAQDSAA